MRKFTRASITSPSDLKYYVVSKTLNPRLINAGGSGLYPTTQKGFLALIDSNQDFCWGPDKRVCTKCLFINHKYWLCTNAFQFFRSWWSTCFTCKVMTLLKTAGLCILVFTCLLHCTEKRIFKSIDWYGIVYDTIWNTLTISKRRILASAHEKD